MGLPASASAIRASTLYMRPSSRLATAAFTRRLGFLGFWDFLDFLGFAVLTETASSWCCAESLWAARAARMALAFLPASMVAAALAFLALGGVMARMPCLA